MEIDPLLLTPGVILCTQIVAALAVLAALLLAPWAALRAATARQHLFFLVTLSLFVLWMAGFRPAGGLSLHLLGMTTATVLLGGALALLAGLLALLLMVAADQALLAALPLTWLLTVAVPALATVALLRLLARLGFRNLFAFLLGIGFAGAMVTILAVVVAGLAVLAAAGQDTLVADAFDHAAMLPLLLFPEGFINGAAVSTLTVYFPHLVRGFDEDHFLGGG